MRKYHFRDIFNLIKRAKLSASPPELIYDDQPYAWSWRISGNCSDPYCHSMWPSKYRDISDIDYKPYLLNIYTRCRHCPECLRHRENLWRCRAIEETCSSPRTWFGTITLTEEKQMLFVNRARLTASKSSMDFELQSSQRQFVLLCKEIGPDLTRWLKRIRKNSNAALRYLLVPEPHASGLPHFHCLVHQITLDETVTYRNLSDAWHLGFTQFNLLDDPQKAGYVAKYITKTLGARVRASKSYGKFKY